MNELIFHLIKRRGEVYDAINRYYVSESDTISSKMVDCLYSQAETYTEILEYIEDTLKPEL